MGNSFIDLSFIQVIAVSYSEALLPGRAKLGSPVPAVLCAFVIVVSPRAHSVL